MEISQKIGQALEEKGAVVVYTRTPKDYWRESYNSVEDNKARAQFANDIGADAYLSIHCDWHPRRKYHGVTTFYASKKSKPLGREIQRAMVRGLRAKNRHLVYNDFTVLKHVKMPAVLIETGFLSHWRESRKLQSPKYQKKIAASILKGLERYFKN